MACEQIERLQKQSGGFGCYLALAHEWANPEATKRSFELIAQRVFPEFQGHAAQTRAAKDRARAEREPLAERSLQAVQDMVDKHQAELARTPSGAANCRPSRPQVPLRLHPMERRIYGLENEYGVTCTLRGQRRLSPDEVARYLFRRVVSWGRSSNVFLQNGARLYLDVGSHPEYATPECDSLYELVVHDKAGERILESLVESAEQRLAEESIRGTIYLFKNNTDSAGNSYGCHENYLHQPPRRSRPLRRGPDPVPRQPPDLRRRRQGPAHRPRGHVLDRPAGRAHLGGRQLGDHPQPPDHQHPRRAARRRRALPPPARDRR